MSNMRKGEKGEGGLDCQHICRLYHTGRYLTVAIAVQ